MPNTVQRRYRGWDVTIRCMQHVAHNNPTGAPVHYTGVAHAQLQFTDHLGKHWIDARPQSVTLSDRSFPKGEHCVEALWAEVKILIDALAKSASIQ